MQRTNSQEQDNRPENKKKTITKPKLILVEGRDDERFVVALLNKIGSLTSEIDVWPVNGKTEFAGALKAIAVSPNIEILDSLGIIRDSNEDPQRTIQSIQSSLQNAGFPVPNEPLERIENGIYPSVCFMTLPDAQTPGELEDLLLRAVESLPDYECIEDFIGCVENIVEPDNSPNNPSKAKIRAFLATRKKPGLHIGEAALASYWPLSDSTFDEIKQFLTQI